MIVGCIELAKCTCTIAAKRRTATNSLRLRSAHGAFRLRLNAPYGVLAGAVALAACESPATQVADGPPEYFVIVAERPAGAESTPCSAAMMESGLSFTFFSGQTAEEVTSRDLEVLRAEYSDGWTARFTDDGEPELARISDFAGLVVQGERLQDDLPTGPSACAHVELVHERQHDPCNAARRRRDP